ncbi:hypothetical protein [Caloranaerobacter sp. TR13]|uniref:hypothetical protein n=1 Tax=Caloranaerobacter sp. TR13 TaxID=1302151 RepID=UPI0013791FB1|nr:hypothetical protein [Caloranaerobacter sp. TR13]
MSNLVSAMAKLMKRKKRNGYYEASEILTVKERNSLIIASITLLIPVLISGLLLIIN